ncbi:hypothetical protein ACXZ1K_07615 [Pedobacter sp. PWIIR3]
MNLAKLTLLLFLLSAAFMSCKKDGIEHKSDLKTSAKTFERFKASSNNSYIYVLTTSSWTGYSSESTVTIKNGAVLSRAYVLKNIDDKTHLLVVVEQWLEDKDHPNPKNWPAALTLDQIYEKAKTEWLVKQKNTDYYLETKNDGMISTCGYVERNCADDCFVGVKISSITKL